VEFTETGDLAKGDGLFRRDSRNQPDSNEDEGEAEIAWRTRETGFVPLAVRSLLARRCCDV